MDFDAVFLIDRDSRGRFGFTIGPGRSNLREYSNRNFEIYDGNVCL